MALTSLTATINGVSYDLTLGDDGYYYSVEIPAGSESSFRKEGGYFPVSISATDDADQTTTITPDDIAWGNNLKLFVREETAPTINITKPASGGYLTSETTPEIKFEILDNQYQKNGFSGINTEEIVLELNGAVIPKADVEIDLDSDGGVCYCSYTPKTSLGNGEYEIKITAKDNDGNSAVATRDFEIDIQKPGLSISSPSDNTVTSNSIIAVEGVVDDKNGPIEVTIEVNNHQQAKFTVDNEDGSFSKDISLVGGNNAIKVSAKDRAGNVETVQIINIKYNSTVPTFTDVQILYNNAQVSASNKVPTTDGKYIIRCKVTTA